jgi:hypothetical protein
LKYLIFLQILCVGFSVNADSVSTFSRNDILGVWECDGEAGELPGVTWTATHSIEYKANEESTEIENFYYDVAGFGPVKFTLESVGGWALDGEYLHESLRSFGITKLSFSEQQYPDLKKALLATIKHKSEVDSHVVELTKERLITQAVDDGYRVSCFKVKGDKN